MAEQSTFPIRNGLQLPRGENLQAVEIFSEGGLDLAQGINESRPGFASDLVNFEAGLKGGYRRIDGYAPYSYTAVPGIGPVIGVADYLSNAIIAARRSSTDTTKYNIYVSSGTSWHKINTSDLDFDAGTIVNNTQYNWTGTPVITFTDGLNHAYKWDGTTFTSLNGSGSPNDPRWAKAFNGYLFLAGYSTNNGALTISAPLDDEDYDPVDGAAEIVVGDEITGLMSWRAELIIFCRNSIWKITGNSTDPNSSAPFTLSPITQRIGCVEGRTIQEINGDLVFLAQDGIRTISGTVNIGDTEIASISRQIQSIVKDINPGLFSCHSGVVHGKTQYRLFYNVESDNLIEAKGIVGSIRRFRDGHEAWEWGELRGIKPSCVDSRYLPDGADYILHGGYDGYVYKQETGDNFIDIAFADPVLYNTGVLFNSGAEYDNVITDDRSINENYKSVPLNLGDYSIRKYLKRVTVYYFSEDVSLNLRMQVIYEYGKTGIIQPPRYIFAATESPYKYDNGVLFDSGAVYNTIGAPIKRQSVQGSGFVTQLQFNSSKNSDSYVIQGFLIEFFPGGRR